MTYWVFLAPLYAVLVFAATLRTLSNRSLDSQTIHVGLGVVVAGALVAVALHVAGAFRASPPVVQATPAGGSCQVCGEQLVSNVVSCLTCATPHHADCFDYARRCSTYGCGCELAA